MCNVSILVPIYNVEKYLGECLSSLMAQTMQEMEIICINDGSTDSSSVIAHEYARQDARFRVIDKENSGYGKSMNLGLREAKGEYIGIVESDDFVEHDMFEMLYMTAKKQKADIVRSDFLIHFYGADIYKKVIDDYYYNKIISAELIPSVFDSSPAIWSNLYSREFLLNNDIFFNETPGASYQDTAFRIKTFICAERMFFLPKAFYHYRRDNDNASVKSSDKLFCVCDEYDEVERFMERRPELVEKYIFLLPFLRFCSYLWNCNRRNLSRSNRLAFINRMYDEYCIMSKRGLLAEGYWKNAQWQNLQMLLSSKERYVYDFLAKEQKNNARYLLLNEILGRKDGRKVAIYGAGQVGKMVLSTLVRNCFKVDCFVVTTRGTENSVEGIPIIPIEEIIDQKDDFIVIIGVGLKKQLEVFAKLNKLEFPHVLLLDNFLLNILL